MSAIRLKRVDDVPVIFIARVAAALGYEIQSRSGELWAVPRDERAPTEISPYGNTWVSTDVDDGK